MRCYLTPVIIQCSEYLPVASRAYAGTGQHDQIVPDKQTLMLAEALFYQAPYTVALHRITGSLYRYRCTQTWMIQIIGYRQHR